VTQRGFKGRAAPRPEPIGQEEGYQIAIWGNTPGYGPGKGSHTPVPTPAEKTQKKGESLFGDDLNHARQKKRKKRSETL